MKIYLETYGCQMNEYDSELIRSILAPRGHRFVQSIEEADVALMNTCAIRENAHRKVYGRLDLLRSIKKQKRPFIVGVLGCMAQNLKDDLLDHPVVNLVVGPDNYKALPELIDRVIETDGPERSGGRQIVDADLSEYETYGDIAPIRVEGVNAWIAVMRGCDNFCSFCVVPYTRGRERSRSVESVLSETRALAEKGYKQVTLLGQNVNSYRSGGASFADLILRVADVPGIERVRFTSPHPKDFPGPLLSAIAGHPRICKHIHLPVQAGSDRILDLMNRTYTRAEYLDLVGRIRNLSPGISLTTDIIVGFPTETEADFDETFRLMEEVRFSSAYIFKYSERKGTIASRKYPDDVPPEAKTDRIVRLFDLQRRISFEKNRALIGGEVEVLIEGDDEKREGRQMGKSDPFATVIFPKTPLGPGALVPVRISDASAGALFGVALAS